jgi:hypothetical protein
MVTGNTGMITKPILRETKVTLYRMHPNQDVNFGLVMVCPNLPAGLQEAEDYRKKGYKSNPQELNPQSEIEKTPEGEMFLVPDGYELKSFNEKTTLADNKTLIDVVNWRVVKKETPPEREIYVSDKEKSEKRK